jgi:TonB-dependent SusC/RagA subfamily outer membrane receptor
MKEILLNKTSMFRMLVIFTLVLPIECFAQWTISGKVIDNTDKKPVANASVFLSNATVGNKTANNGTFILSNAKPGKYELIVSIVGFETYRQTITVSNSNISLPDILISSKAIALKEVSIKFKTDPDREKYYNLFKDEFLGTSEIAKECKILNPKILDLDYDDATNTLTASSYDFLEIENDALGYKIKYLLTDFSFQNKDINEKKIYYKGPVLFEELKGTSVQKQRWKERREEVYENSPMHFLRSALSNRIDEEGFRVQQLAIYANPERPSDSLIDARIKFYKDSKSRKAEQRDSLSYWIKKSKLPKIFKTLMPFSLNKQDIIKATDQPGQYALGCDNDGLLVAYNKNHHFYINDKLNYLYNPGNTDNTLVLFNSPYAFLYNNGILSDPYSVMYYGVWGRNRVAELLPIDYESPRQAEMPIDAKGGNITIKLNAFLTEYVTEKAYLHFDKPYYAAGDTIYFKAYVTLGEKHELSNLSGVLHVDLINTQSKIDQSIKLQLINGVAWGDFALPDSLPKGNYRIRAYTNWMRNDETGFFDQTIPVGSFKTNHVPESAIKQQLNSNKADIQFFPEGGSLVTGIRSKIAFKAIGTNGLGINAKGMVLDNENKEICSFSSSHLGIGYFYLDPQEGKTYKAKLSYADGSQSTIDLPKLEARGITLSVNNDSIGKASVKIEANKTCFEENKNKDYNLIIYSGGIVTTVNCKLDSTVITLDIIKRRLHSGIATITLFSPTGEPLCERLLFIQSYDQLNLNISADKASHTKREKVSIKLNVKNRADDPAVGHFSVSVIDENKVPVEGNKENTILTNLLLTSDLKGYVEQPNYYFTNITDNTNSDLDLIMLTHGYRRFEWKQLLNNNYPPVTYQPEKGLEISGMAKNILGKPLSNGIVSLIPSPSGTVLSQQTDDKGNFHFSNLVFMDSACFVLQAVNAKGKNSTQLVYSKDKSEPALKNLMYADTSQVTTTYLENSEKQQEQLSKLGLGKGKMLREVKIREKKRDDDYPSSNLGGPGHADQVIHRSEFRGGGLFSDQFNGWLRGVSFGGGNAYLSGGQSMGINKTGAMLIVVDGNVMSGMPVDDINVNAIETIEVLKGANAAIYGFNSLNGVLVITTRKGEGLQAKDIVSTGILPITIKGFYKAREFYAPKYENKNLNNNISDLRSTIYWKPELITDKYGNASFEYYNADGTGTYRVVIEGIDEKGNLGRQVYRYKVE